LSVSEKKCIVAKDSNLSIVLNKEIKMGEPIHDHNVVTAEKIATAQEQALTALATRKSLEAIGYTESQGAYEDYLAKIYSLGNAKADRTGTGTLSLFGLQMRFNLQEGFPLITTKKVYVRAIIEELRWLLKGLSNNNWLKERKVTIWDEWAPPDGELGPIYGVQWRSWPDYDGGTIDQIAEAIHLLKTNPDSRRIIVNSWNVAQLNQMALMPCHAFFQFYVANGELSCQLYQRSADSFLGVPFNISSYAMLTHMVAQQCDLGVGDFIWTGGDCHIYSNHLSQVELQLSRKARPYPKLTIKRKPSSIDEYLLEDFEFIGYDPHPAIQAPVAK
jgi:thymidylate synthase